MYCLNYLQYFIYLAWYWNLRLAWFVVVREISGEKKYNIKTTGINELRSSLSKEDSKHASIYQPVNFYAAEMLFGQLHEPDFKGSLVDAGCGMGRVMAMAAYKGFAKIHAFDLSPEMCADAVVMANKLQQIYPAVHIEVDCENAADYRIPDDAGVLFLFNPFDDIIMEPLAKQVIKSLKRSPRSFKVLYANPVHKKVWEDLGFQEIFHFQKLRYLEGSVLQYSP